MANQIRISRFAAADRLTIHIIQLPSHQNGGATCEVPGCALVAQFGVGGPLIKDEYKTCRKHIAHAAANLIGDHFGEQETPPINRSTSAGSKGIELKAEEVLAQLSEMNTKELDALRRRLGSFIGAEWSTALDGLSRSIDRELRRRNRGAR